MIALVDDEEFPDGHDSRAFLFRVGEQVFQPIQADSLLPDLRHQPKAPPAHDPPVHSCGTSMPVSWLSELFEVHAVPPCSARRIAGPIPASLK